MSTSGTILVAIPADKRGATYKFNKGENEFDTPEITIPEDANYVEVYHHWDSYCSGLGEYLINPENNFNDFDTIMTNIIAGGDMSIIGTPYHAWRNEDWDDVQPKFSTEIPNVSEEYQYLWSLNNEWLVRGDKYNKELQEFIKVEDALKEEY